MQVSAVNIHNDNGYNLSNGTGINNNRFNDQNRDTSFNSLTPYSSKRTVSAERLPIVFDSINQWKNFCHRQVLGEKLNIIA